MNSMFSYEYMYVQTQYYANERKRQWILESAEKDTWVGLKEANWRDKQD